MHFNLPPMPNFWDLVKMEEWCVKWKLRQERGSTIVISSTQRTILVFYKCNPFQHPYTLNTNPLHSNLLPIPMNSIPWTPSPWTLMSLNSMPWTPTHMIPTPYLQTLMIQKIHELKWHLDGKLCSSFVLKSDQIRSEDDLEANQLESIQNCSIVSETEWSQICTQNCFR
jgi:hypothetical protein